MSETNPRQTRSYLMKRFKEVGIRPKSRWGQNFLIDLNLLDVLLEAARIDENDVVLEIGGGTGSLSGMMAEKAAHVVSVEIDRQLAQLARESLVALDNYTLLEQDALYNKNRLSDVVLDTVKKHLDAKPGRRFKLVANLPYNVATPILSTLLLSTPLVHSMTVTIQRELGERMVAVPSTKDYSALSIWMQCQCDCQIVRIMPNTVFWPRPNVESAIMHIAVNPEKRGRIADLPFFHTFGRALFFHRRKFLRSVMASAFKGRLEKEQIDAVMAELELGPTARAEELSVDRLILLGDALRRQMVAAGLATSLDLVDAEADADDKGDLE